MNWLTNYVRPKIQSLVKTRDVPDNLWIKCPSCSAMLFHRELEQNDRICHHCNHHLKINSTARLALMFDEGKYETMPLPEVTEDPLEFEAAKKYPDQLKKARKATQLQEGIVIAYGLVDGQQAVVGCMEGAFIGGSMGAAVGEAIVAAADLAIKRDAAFIMVTNSGGARMQEGILSLMQMARTTIAINKVRDSGLPYLVVLTDPTTGGVTASFAMLGDVAMAEPGSLIGFAGPRVIEDTIRQVLPGGFQRAEYLLDHGMIDMIVDRREMRATLGRIISLLRGGKAGTALTVTDKPKATKAAKKADKGDDKPAAARETKKK